MQTNRCNNSIYKCERDITQCITQPKMQYENIKLSTSVYVAEMRKMSLKNRLCKWLVRYNDHFVIILKENICSSNRIAVFLPSQSRLERKREREGQAEENSNWKKKRSKINDDN